MNDRWPPHVPPTKPVFNDKAEGPGGVPLFRKYSTEQLEAWKKSLEENREVPELVKVFTFGGQTEAEVHKKVAANREALIQRIAMEQAHRIERDRLASLPGRKQDDPDRGGRSR
jgi:hypothetical protein